MNAAIVQNTNENVTHTAPAASGRFSSNSSFACCSLVFPNPTLMFTSTTDTRPVPRPVNMIASHTSAPLMCLRGTGSMCACVEWLPVVPPKSPVPAPPASPNLSGRCIGDPAVCTASASCTVAV